MTGRFGSRRPESRREEAVLWSAKTADGAASRTTLLSRCTNAEGRANPSSDGKGTGTAPIIEAPRKPSRKARPVGTQRSTRSPRLRPMPTRAAAQVPAPCTQSPSVTSSSRKAPFETLRSRWTAGLEGSFAARARRRAAMESGIRDQPFHQPLPEPATQARHGEPAALELLRHQRPVAVEHAQPLQPIECVAAHAARGEPELGPDGLRQQGGDAGANALEDEVLHPGGDPAAEDPGERCAQLVSVRQVPGLVLEVRAQQRREQRLARFGEQRGNQRGGRPLEYDLADEQLHLRRGALLQRVQGRVEAAARGVEDAGFLRGGALRREEMLR